MNLCGLDFLCFCLEFQYQPYFPCFQPYWRCCCTLNLSHCCCFTLDNGTLKFYPYSSLVQTGLINIIWTYSGLFGQRIRVSATALHPPRRVKCTKTANALKKSNKWQLKSYSCLQGHVFLSFWVRDRAFPLCKIIIFSQRRGENCREQREDRINNRKEEDITWIRRVNWIIGRTCISRHWLDNNVCTCVLSHRWNYTTVSCGWDIPERFCSPW